MHPYLCSAPVTDCRSKVRDLVLVKRMHPQPSTALVPRIYTESVRFGCKEDGTFCLKIVPWQKFKNEIQFSHFHGSERQSRPIHASCSEEDFHAAQVFRMAGAIDLPASILHDVPLSCPQPPQEDPLERHDSPSVRKCNNPPSGNSMDTPISSNTPEAHQTLANEIERLPPFSTSKAWYREKFFSPILNLPTLIRSEQSTSRERERSQVINDVDRLCAALDTTTLEEQNINGMPIDSGFKQNSCGSSNHASGSRGSRKLVGGGGQRSAGSSGEPEPNRKRSSEGEDESSAPKRTKDSDPKSNDMFQCRIYKKSNTPRDGGSSTNSVYTYQTCNGKPFQDYGRMVDHLLRVHIRPCQCGRCMSRFGRPSERNRHEDKVCKAKGLVQRTKKDPNDVPDYVVTMGKKYQAVKILTRWIRYFTVMIKKQYDFLDQTDVQKKPVSNSALEGAPKDLVPRPPSSTTTHAHSLEKVEGGTSNIGPFPASGLDEGHKRAYGIHMNHLDDLFPGGSQSSGLDGGPSGLNLETDLELLDDLNLVRGTTNSFEPCTATAKEIEKIITNSVDAETDPERYKELINILFFNLPKPLSDALVEHARRCPENIHIAPSVLSWSELAGPYGLNDFAHQLASEGDEIPVPPLPHPDSGYPASSPTTPDLTDNDMGDLQAVKEWCDTHRYSNEKLRGWSTTNNASDTT